MLCGVRGVLCVQCECVVYVCVVCVCVCDGSHYIIPTGETTDKTRPCASQANEVYIAHSVLLMSGVRTHAF